MTLLVAPPVLVIDASVAVRVLTGLEPWVGTVQAYAGSDAVFLAPAHFRAEVANALLRSVRLDPADVVARLEGLERLEIGSPAARLGDLIAAVELAARHRLSVHDAAYLDLAISVDGDLLTEDRALRDAAIAEGVVVAE